MFITNAILGGEFVKLGLEIFHVIQLDPDLRNDALDRVFPKLSKCTINQYGPSGNIENIEATCSLPLNTITEKVYVGAWYWFAFVMAITTFYIIYRVLAIVFIGYRFSLIKKKVKNTYINRKSNVFRN